jgi:hypothetical protein
MSRILLKFENVTYNSGGAMAQAVSRWPLTAAAWVRAQANPVGFVVNKVALGQIFLRVLRLSPGSTFRKLKKNIHSSIRPGTDNRPVKTAAIQ